MKNLIFLFFLQFTKNKSSFVKRAYSYSINIVIYWKIHLFINLSIHQILIHLKIFPVSYILLNSGIQTTRRHGPSPQKATINTQKTSFESRSILYMKRVVI